LRARAASSFVSRVARTRFISGPKSDSRAACGLSLAGAASVVPHVATHIHADTSKIRFEMIVLKLMGGTGERRTLTLPLGRTPDKLLGPSTQPVAASTPAATVARRADPS
jgi:hypothetical protein